MEAKRLKKNLEALIGTYIGQKLRENGFDPKGKRSQTLLDDLVHYDLAINVALWWLNKYKGKDLTESDITGISGSDDTQYPNHMEREAMILSSFAGIILNSLPVEEILSLYKYKPSFAYQEQNTKNTIVHPFSLSYHPFAMLTAYKTVHHSWMHSQKRRLCRSSHCSVRSPTEQDTLADTVAPALQSPESDDPEHHKALQEFLKE
ncbi:uncharacterized protein C2orf80 [Scleropages formosus]|uniref:uncharacterized protein C2orf80 n=1 Tax=Scleropages formosus TaxID=113540 RepID=UPI0010FAB337|nr:uncharacterized protein C2orf80 homolog [Scleropages formosus]